MTANTRSRLVVRLALSAALALVSFLPAASAPDQTRLLASDPSYPLPPPPPPPPIQLAFSGASPDANTHAVLNLRA